MDFVEPIAVFVAGVLAATVVDGQVCIAPFGQATVDIVLVGIDRGVGAMVDLISGPMVTCLTFSSIRMTTIPPR